MQLWSLLYCVSGLTICCYSLAQAQNVQKRSIENYNPNSNHINSQSTIEGRGFWNRFSGIFQSISNYFGFSKAKNEKDSRVSSVVRRPEIIPFELQNMKNRRSGMEAPNGYPDPYQQFPESQSRIKNQKLQMQRGVSVISNKLKPPFSRNDDSSGKFDSSNKFDPPNHGKSNFMVVHVKDEKFDSSRLPVRSDDDYQQTSGVAKVESREPLVSVYSKGIPTTKKSPPKAIHKGKQSNPVHSKFSLDKYSAENGNPNSNDPIITNNKESNSFMVTSSFSHGKKEDKPLNYKDRKANNPDEKYISQTRNSNSQEWYSDSNKNAYTPELLPSSVRKQRYRNYYNTDSRDTLQKQEQDIKPFFASPLSDAPPSPKRNEKRKGLIGSMTNFASNFFSNLMPKSPTSHPFPGNSLNPPPPQAFHSLPSTKIEFVEKRSPPMNSPLSQQQNQRTSNHQYNNRFAPSPLQGNMKVDSFQPIFVPSPSLDSKLPSDAMKPMIIPQKRIILTSPSPVSPAMIDFF